MEDRSAAAVLAARYLHRPTGKERLLAELVRYRTHPVPQHR